MIRRLRVAFALGFLGFAIGLTLACKDQAPPPCVPTTTITVDTITHSWTMEGTVCKEPAARDGTVVVRE